MAFARYDGTGANPILPQARGGGPRVMFEQLRAAQIVSSPTRIHRRRRVATGDVTGDSVDDIVCRAGRRAPTFASTTEQAPLREFMAYDSAFSGGVYVAVGDVTGDGKAEIAAGAGERRAAVKSSMERQEPRMSSWHTAAACGWQQPM